MNIFVTDYCPIKSAEALDDKRVNKMILESTQLMSNAAHEYCPDLAPYRKTHFNHPCSIWTRKHRANYQWLFLHWGRLLTLYSEKSGKQHACGKLYSTIEQIGYSLEDTKLHNPFVNCSLFKNELDIIKAYQDTMIHKWQNDKRTPTWVNRTKPIWYIG